MKQITFLFLCFFLLFASGTIAQQTENFDPVKDVKEVSGFIIHLMPMPGNTFGFTVVKDKKPVWSQLNNPFVQSAITGFKTKQEAFSLAEWVVNEQEKNSHAPVVFAPQLAAQLHIAADKQPK